VVVVLGGPVVTALVLTALIVGVSLDVPEPTTTAYPTQPN
jgi:hypothetical protein